MAVTRHSVPFPNGHSQRVILRGCLRLQSTKKNPREEGEQFLADEQRPAAGMEAKFSQQHAVIVVGDHPAHHHLVEKFRHPGDQLLKVPQPSQVDRLRRVGEDGVGIEKQPGQHRQMVGRQGRGEEVVQPLVATEDQTPRKALQDLDRETEVKVRLHLRRHHGRVPGNVARRQGKLVPGVQSCAALPQHLRPLGWEGRGRGQGNGEASGRGLDGTGRRWPDPWVVVREQETEDGGLHFLVIVIWKRDREKLVNLVNSNVISSEILLAGHYQG